MQKGVLLLASSGKEFTKPTGILANSAEVKRARKEAMGRLGLDFLDSVGAAEDMDIDKELAIETEVDTPSEADAHIKREEPAVSPMEVDFNLRKERSPPPRSQSSTPAVSSPVTPVPPIETADLGVLSARERNRLKRKRKVGSSAFVAAPPPPPSSAGARYSTTAAGPSNK
jgi:TATA-binding protein-associated factor